jgi:hypothetical protein
VLCVPAAIVAEGHLWGPALQTAVATLGPAPFYQLLALSGLFYHLYNQVGGVCLCVCVACDDSALSSSPATSSTHTHQPASQPASQPNQPTDRNTCQYRQASYMVLDAGVSPVTFSVGNTMKRVAVVVSSVMFFRWVRAWVLAGGRWRCLWAGRGSVKTPCSLHAAGRTLTCCKKTHTPPTQEPGECYELGRQRRRDCRHLLLQLGNRQGQGRGSGKEEPGRQVRGGCGC